MFSDENVNINHALPEPSDSDNGPSKSAVRGFEKLLQEKEHWRAEALRFTEEVTRLQSQVATLREERDAKELVIDSLKRDEQVFNNKISALVSEHRELKNHWLAEKADLQTRLYQIQALNTQLQGTSKKKDKDYEKLQNQLSKLVKDSGRGAIKPSITISVPLKKAHSQETTSSTAASLLRDAELSAVRNALAALSKDNVSLKSSMEELQQELVRLRVIDAPVGPSSSENLINRDKIVPPSTDDVSSSVPNSPPKGPSTLESVVEVSAATPVTPGVRSVRWLIDQTNTAVKQLRDRTDSIAANKLPSTSQPKDQNGAAESIGANTAALVSLKTRLTEALRVIEEQDRLIHEALLGKLPGQLRPDAQPAELIWEDEVPFEFAHHDIDSAGFHDKEISDLTASTKKLRRRSLRTSELVENPTNHHVGSKKTGQSRRTSFSLEEFEADLLPPASPETLQLLEQGGWQLPKNTFLLPPHAPSTSAATQRERFSLGGPSMDSATTAAESSSSPAQNLEF